MNIVHYFMYLLMDKKDINRSEYFKFLRSICRF